MDVYTTSFCLPPKAATPDLEDPAPSFELPRDVAAAAAAQNHPGPSHLKQHGRHSSSSSSSLSQLHRVPSSGLDNVAERPDESSGASSVASSSRDSANTAVVGTSYSGLPARRSTSSIASLGQTATSASSVVGDVHSTAPSSAAASIRGTQQGLSSSSKSRGDKEPENADAAAALQAATVEQTEQMQKICMEAMSNYQCMVTCSPLENNKGFNFHLSGGYQQVMGARGYIYRASPLKNKSVVKVPRSEVLDAKENVKTEMRKKLDEIAALTKAHLAIVGQVSGTIGFGLETERNVEIVITGMYENVEQARVRLLVLLDELVSRYHHITFTAVTNISLRITERPSL